MLFILADSFYPAVAAVAGGAIAAVAVHSTTAAAAVAAVAAGAVHSALLCSYPSIQQSLVRQISVTLIDERIRNDRTPIHVVTCPLSISCTT